jgi:hypothetical protein
MQIPQMVSLKVKGCPWANMVSDWCPVWLRRCKTITTTDRMLFFFLVILGSLLRISS